MQFIPETVKLHNMWNERISGNILIARIAQQLQASLPSNWTVALSLDPELPVQPNALLEIIPPGQERASVLVDAKQRIEPRDVPAVLEQLRRYGGGGSLVIAPFLSPRTRGLLAAAGAGYADATGNLRLVLDRPTVFIERSGATSDPWRENRPLHSLKGPAAARVVRALCDFRPPYTVGELAVRSGAPIASVSRVLSLLDREALIARGPRSSVADVRWAELIHRWVEDYSLTESNRARGFVASRGMMALNYQLQQVDWRYAITGEQAAVHKVPLIVVSLGVLYVDDSDLAAQQLGVRPAEAGANLLLVEPFDPVVYKGTWGDLGVRWCAVSQVAADLLTSPGRGPSEGEELLQWMEQHEDEWRS